jgi:hypothetical protein
MTYNTDRYRFDVKAVLDFLREKLQKVRQAFVSKMLFTETNVYSAFHKNSIGLSVEPASNVMLGPIVFTFAMSKLDNAHQPAILSRLDESVVVWASRSGKMMDFFSISIPVNICSRTGLDKISVPDLKALYDIVGAFSKSVILNHSPMLSHNPDIIANILHWTIPRAMWSLCSDDWKYCLDFWQRMPDLLNVTWDSLFVEYYCRFIAPNLQLKHGFYYDLYYEQVLTEIRQFILRYLQNEVLPEEQNLLRFLPVMDEYTDVEKLAADIAQGKIQ